MIILLAKEMTALGLSINFITIFYYLRHGYCDPSCLLVRSLAGFYPEIKMREGVVNHREGVEASLGCR